MAAIKSKAKSKSKSTAKAKVKTKLPVASKASSKASSKTKASAKTAKAKSRRSSKAKAVSSAATQNELVLPERFDSSTAASVLAGFKSHRGNTLIVDASAVRRVGAQSIQILVSASRTWRTDGNVLSVQNPSAELIEAACLLGLPSSELSFPG